MSNNTSTSSGGIGLPGLLTVLFIGLKLTGYISWSWWWVLSPLIITFSIGLLIILAFIVLALIDMKR
jgi:hypothetical protein